MHIYHVWWQARWDCIRFLWPGKSHTTTTVRIILQVGILTLWRYNIWYFKSKLTVLHVIHWISGFVFGYDNLLNRGKKVYGQLLMPTCLRNYHSFPVNNNIRRCSSLPSTTTQITNSNVKNKTVLRNSCYP